MRRGAFAHMHPIQCVQSLHARCPQLCSLPLPANSNVIECVCVCVCLHVAVRLSVCLSVSVRVSVCLCVCGCACARALHVNLYACILICLVLLWGGWYPLDENMCMRIP